jgi:hypothetical protein
MVFWLPEKSSESEESILWLKLNLSENNSGLSQINSPLANLPNGRGMHASDLATIAGQSGGGYFACHQEVKK